MMQCGTRTQSPSHFVSQLIPNPSEFPTTLKLSDTLWTSPPLTESWWVGSTGTPGRYKGLCSMLCIWTTIPWSVLCIALILWYIEVLPWWMCTCQNFSNPSHYTYMYMCMGTGTWHFLSGRGKTSLHPFSLDSSDQSRNISMCDICCFPCPVSPPRLQFCKDMWLMFENAWLYNKKTSRVYKFCTKLSEVFDFHIDSAMQSLGYCCGKRVRSRKSPPLTNPAAVWHVGKNAVAVGFK